MRSQLWCYGQGKTWWSYHGWIWYDSDVTEGCNSKQFIAPIHDHGFKKNGGSLFLMCSPHHWVKDFFYQRYPQNPRTPPTGKNSSSSWISMERRSQQLFSINSKVSSLSSLSRLQDLVIVEKENLADLNSPHWCCCRHTRNRSQSSILSVWKFSVKSILLLLGKQYPRRQANKKKVQTRAGDSSHDW